MIEIPRSLAQPCEAFAFMRVEASLQLLSKLDGVKLCNHFDEMMRYFWRWCSC